jgi:lipid-A-disaccharide synthase
LKSIALLSGEPSGDLQAAALARALKHIDPSLQLWGTGGKHLRQAGVEIVEDISGMGVMGVFEALPKLKGIWDTYHRMRARLVERRPDLTVMIDTPAINMRLADLLRQESLRSIYYFPPSGWTTNLERLAKIQSKVDAVVPCFSYNASNYEKAGIEHAFFGHPLVDLFQPIDPMVAQARLGLDPGRTYVALLPGSRIQEVRCILPTFVEVARRLRRYRPDLEFLLPIASQAVEPLVLEMVGDCGGIHIIKGQSRWAMASSRLALMASGSATLESALLGIPLVLCYRANAFDYGLGQLLRKTGILNFKRWGLPNIVLQEDIMPELLQYEANPGRLVMEAMLLLDDTPTRQNQLADLQRIRETLGGSGVVEKVARFTYEFGCGKSVAQARLAAQTETMGLDFSQLLE